MTNKADFYIKKLNLEKHPEGGWFRECYKSAEVIGQYGLPQRFHRPRFFATSIYYLLESHDFSTFHVLKQDETIHFYTGSPINLHMLTPTGEYHSIILGANISNNQLFQYTVPHGTIFGMNLIDSDSFSLIGCSVAPGFDYDDFKIPSKEELLSSHPEAKEIIEKLTR